ncbi:hypothetical protein V8F06_007319 [Rhypophila decipiens]
MLSRMLLSIPTVLLAFNTVWMIGTTPASFRRSQAILSLDVGLPDVVAVATAPAFTPELKWMTMEAVKPRAKFSASCEGLERGNGAAKSAFVSAVLVGSYQPTPRQSLSKACIG